MGRLLSTFQASKRKSSPAAGKERAKAARQTIAVDRNRITDESLPEETKNSSPASRVSQINSTQGTCSISKTHRRQSGAPHCSCSAHSSSNISRLIREAARSLRLLANRTGASPRLRQSLAALDFGYGLNERRRLRAKRGNRKQITKIPSCSSSSVPPCLRESHSSGFHAQRALPTGGWRGSG